MLSFWLDSGLMLMFFISCPYIQKTGLAECARLILTQCCCQTYALFFVKNYWMSTIYALLAQNFAVRIYVLFPQIFLDWKAKYADIFNFWIYDPATEDKHFVYWNQQVISCFRTVGPGCLKMCDLSWQSTMRIVDNLPCTSPQNVNIDLQSVRVYGGCSEIT